MSAPLACPRCGFQNQPGYQFCTNCGAPLAPAPSAMAPAVSGAAPYGYPAPATGHDWQRQVDRTRTGIFLLLVGSLLSWEPYGISILGDLLLFIGAILVILGRKAFGPTHSRNVVVSILLFVVGIFIILIVAVVALLPSLPSLANTGGVMTPALQAAANNAELTGSIASAIVIGIAEVLFTYALQLQRGRLLLWAGYGANLAVTVTLYVIMSPVYSLVATQADLDAATSMQTLYSLLAVVPALLFAAADYLAWSRINRREIPAAPSAPVATWTPPAVRPPSQPPATPPQPPQPPPPSGPAPPANPP